MFKWIVAFRDTTVIYDSEHTSKKRLSQDDDDGGGVAWRGDSGWWWWRVEASEVVGRVDPVVRTIFGFDRKIPPEKFSGGGGVVVVGIRRRRRWWGGGRIKGEGERMKRVSKLVGHAIGALVKGGSRSEVPTQVKVAAYRGQEKERSFENNILDIEIDTNLKIVLEKENEVVKSEIGENPYHSQLHDVSITGLHHAKECVIEMAIWPLLLPNIFKGCRSPGQGLLLFGPPGAESVNIERDGIAELQDLQCKVKVIKKAVIEIQMLTVQEKLDADAKLESAMKQIEELINQKNSRIPNGKPKSTSEISETDPKDIMLDQTSECSSYRVSKRGLIDGEIWETTDISNTFKHHPTASEVSLDNNFDMVEKLEVSKRFKEHRDDGNKRKVLERLNSDVQKLTNLQITIDDLKRKAEITSQSRRGKAMIECETLKGQHMEAESAIQKLFELNWKLVKHIKGNPKKSTSESGESEIMRMKKVSDQAKRVSEKIGRLQLEIQKIQFVLLKLDDKSTVVVVPNFKSGVTGQFVLESLFTKIDQDGDANISFPELKELLQDVKFRQLTWGKEQTIKQVMKEFDYDGDTKVTVDEFTDRFTK
ncbi:NETWORKED 1D-like protein [Tanacetum coccineum]